MQNDDRAALLALCRVKGLNWNLIAREAQRPGGIDRLMQGELTEHSATATRARQVLSDVLASMDTDRAEMGELIRQSTDDGISLTTVLDDDYPLNLRRIFNLPPFLFYRGSLMAQGDARSVAVVGTREASAEGLESARKMARLLSKEGVTVLSGLARGIDTAAHEATLAMGGRTIAVMGTGIRRIYPAENKGIAEALVKRGAIVSQFWPDATPATYTFPRRNITMSGMGQGTVVIEASSTSGAKMQARLALEHGKKVFLVHRLVTEQEWARKYVDERGAIEVSCVEDIVERMLSADDIASRNEDARQLSLGLE